MPYEEHLGGFFQMGFHVISCVELMNVVNVECYVDVVYFILLQLLLDVCRNITDQLRDE